MKRIAGLYQILILILMIMSMQQMVAAQGTNKVNLQWSVPVQIPAPKGSDKQLGVAGAFTGIHHNMLIVAGGANFPDEMPWRGGKKKYRDEIYVLKLSDDNAFIWMDTRALNTLTPIAYGSSVSLEDAMVCVGGETNQGLTSRAFMMQWNDANQTVVTKDLPNLPIPVANASMTAVGKTIYLAGGETDGKVSDAFFMLDLGTSNPVWQVLPPVPLNVSHALLVAQSNGSNTCLYLIGGRTRQTGAPSDLHHSVFCYNIAEGKWTEKGAIHHQQKTINYSAGTGVAIGDHYIALLGGDHGEVFHKIEKFNLAIEHEQNENEKKKLQMNKALLLNNHQGFSKECYLYDTKNDQWTRLNHLPFFAQVTTTAIKWKDQIIIPSGEIKPGQRTANISFGKIKLTQ